MDTEFVCFYFSVLPSLRLSFRLQIACFLRPCLLHDSFRRINRCLVKMTSLTSSISTLIITEGSDTGNFHRRDSESPRISCLIRRFLKILNMIPRFQIKIPEIRNKIPEIRPFIRHYLGQDLGQRFARSFRESFRFVEISCDSVIFLYKHNKFISTSINHYYETSYETKPSKA